MKQTKVYVAFLIPLTACTMVLLLLTISEWKETFHLNTSKEENSNKSIPILCADPDWCNIEMPSDSLFRFPAPTNRTLWRLAQVHAWRGDQILLQKSIEAIKTPMEFLVGDINFREYHSMFDYFLDPQHDFSFLTHQNRTTPPYKSAIPRAYLPKNRAALVSASYVVTEKRKGQHSAPFFFGLKQRMQYLYLDHILAQWKYWKNEIKKSFVLMSSFDENWGLLSTVFPGRTGDWSRCCSPRVYGLLREMLSDDKLVMMLINQHHNFTHPKLVTLPRGLPIYGENQRRLLWNTMISRVHRQKSLWIFTASSSWGHRPGIAKCILNNIGNHSDVVMELHGRDLKGRSGERAYYPRLSSARISIALPGIGYETFR